MPTTPCSECDEEIEVAGRVRLGQKLTCNFCGAALEVVATEPLELEPAQDDDDELWDDDELEDEVLITGLASTDDLGEDEPDDVDDLNGDEDDDESLDELDDFEDELDDDYDDDDFDDDDFDDDDDDYDDFDDDGYDDMDDDDRWS